MEHRLFRQLAFSPLKSLAESHPTFSADTLEEIDQDHLKVLAEQILAWAKKHGVTHYTFWVQPQTNETIEKHDAFFELEHLFHAGLKFKQVENFTGRVLQKGQGDGSSFPNGGLRGTERARGYIAWDCKSDVFIREGINKTLYLPAMMLTHNGEALDEKSYLRRAEAKLKQSASSLLRLLGIEQVKCVNFCLGIEQEFFVVRKEDFERRLDLSQTGRTLYGKLPPRNQQFSDHYYGRLPDRMFELLSECENQLLKLGVPVKTKHKQVAINQFEMSAYYEDAGTSVDHNMLVMDVLRSTFDKHGYAVLFHEKPFRSANGSGKHCNWSLQYSREGKFENLFEPGTHPEKNSKFLLFLLMTLRAVQRNAGLLKASITSASNENRMGGHEAPPCIISVFLGSYLDRLLNCVEQGREFTEHAIDLAKLIPGMQTFMQDNTDRNRTSPFAFTGNKFEFRAVGSKQNVAFPMAVLAAILTQEMNEAAEQLSKGIDVWDLIRKLISETKSIRFEGDGYGREWELEAERRGLPHLKTAKASYECIRSANVLKQLEIFNERELQAKYNILVHAYQQAKVAEARTLLVLIQQQFMPRVLSHLERLSQFKTSSKIVFAKHFDRFENFYEQLDSHADTLACMVQEVSKQERSEARLDKSTELRSKIDELSKFLSEVEAQLPKNEGQSPQLFDILNKY